MNSIGSRRPTLQDPDSWNAPPTSCSWRAGEVWWSKVNRSQSIIDHFLDMLREGYVRFRRHIAGGSRADSVSEQGRQKKDAPRPRVTESLQDPYATRGLPELSFYDDRSKYSRADKADFLSANMFEHGLHGERLSDFAVGLVEALVAILIGALFMAWLSSSHSTWQSSSGFGSGCPTLGRGGNPCVLHPERNERADDDAHAERELRKLWQGRPIVLLVPVECGSNKSAMSNDARRQAWRTTCPSLKLRGCPDRRSCSRAR